MTVGQSLVWRQVSPVTQVFRLGQSRSSSQPPPGVPPPLQVPPDAARGQSAFCEQLRLESAAQLPTVHRPPGLVQLRPPCAQRPKVGQGTDRLQASPEALQRPAVCGGQSASPVHTSPLTPQTPEVMQSGSVLQLAPPLTQ